MSPDMADVMMARLARTEEANHVTDARAIRQHYDGWWATYDRIESEAWREARRIVAEADRRARVRWQEANSTSRSAGRERSAAAEEHREVEPSADGTSLRAAG